MNMIQKLKYYMKNHISERNVGKIRYLKNKIKEFYAKQFHSESIKKMGKFMSTDKVGSHSYGDIYDNHFKRFKNKKINLLEIGIGGYEDNNIGGESLRLWRNYFRRGMIYGIDIYEKDHLNEERIKTFVCDQSNPDQLNKLANKIGKIDIVIDDGSHINSHVITSFKNLFRHVSIGGIYVVEDTQTSYWEEYGGRPRESNSKDTTMEFFKYLVDGLNYQEFKDRSYDPTYYDKHITEIHFYHNIVFIKKDKNH